MSGFEVVGIILGGIPIVVTMFEKYSTLVEGVSAFRKPNRAARFYAIMDTEKARFQNSATHLLEIIEDNRELIDGLLSELPQSARDTSHDSNPMHQLTDRQRKIVFLEESLASCLWNLEQIQAGIGGLTEKLSEILDPLDAFASEKHPRTRDRLLRMRSGMKFAFGNAAFSRDIDDLRTRNSSLDALTPQIVASVHGFKDAGGESQVRIAVQRTARSINKLDKYHQIRLASAALYETLSNSWTCNMPNHDTHVAKVSCVDVLELASADFVKLRVGLISYDFRGELGHQSVADDANLLWLEVEHRGTIHGQWPAPNPNASPGLLDNLESAISSRTGQLAAEALSKKITKTVRFAGSPGSETAHSAVASISANTNSTSTRSQQVEPKTEVINLKLVADICDYVYLQYLKCQPCQCLGYLQGSYIQRFYRPPSQPSRTGHPVLLSGIISWARTRPFGGTLPPPIALHVASSLATSVLQFHSTPWLPETWRTDDITFFNVEDLSIAEELNLTYPYFKVEFAPRKCTAEQKRKAIAIEPYHATAEGSSLSTITGARNELLFRLGIVLIEVGLSRPWQELREYTLTRSNLSPNRRTDYNVAEALAQSTDLKNKRGPRYVRIVKKCIGCDFGLSEPQIDLTGSEELQTVFLLQVVDELQQLKLRAAELFSI